MMRAKLPGSCLFVALLASVASVASAQVPASEEEFAKTATWQIPAASDVQAQLTAWLAERKAAAEIQAKAAALWPADEASVPAGEMLDRVIATFALVDPQAKQVVEICQKPREGVLPPKFDGLDDEKLAPFVRQNLKLYVGRWLTQNRMYDESLAMFDKLSPKDVVDPTSLLFYQSIAHHWLLHKEPGLKVIGQLLERRKDIPRRYETLADLMQGDLSALKDDSLDHVSRRMDDATRRLELGRAGKKVQGIEDGIVKSLDKMIEELEKQKNGSGSGNGSGGPGQSGNPNGTQPTSPASESKIADGKAPGTVGKKPIGSSSGWGDLPPKQREEALQQIGKDFPAHYRDAIEQYFRKLASEESDSGK